MGMSIFRRRIGRGGGDGDACECAAGQGERFVVKGGVAGRGAATGDALHAVKVKDALPF